MASAAILAIVAFAPNTAQAAASVTQLEYLQWLVQLSGDTHQFSESSQGSDYVNWARSKGMEPRGGWQLRGKLNKDVLAQTLVQFLKLNSYKQGDYLRTLARYGIILPSEAEISRKDLARFVDYDLQPRHTLFRRPRSPHKPDRDRDKDRDDDDRPRPRDRDRDRDDDRGGGGGGGGGGGDDDDDDGGGRPPGNGGGKGDDDD